MTHTPNDSQQSKTLSEVTAAILVGGLGTRLRSVVADRPKVLAEIGGKPCLAYLLDGLVQAGVRDVVLCIGYLGEQIRSYFGDRYDSLRLIYSQEEVLLGTAGALRLALPYLQSESVLVMNGDSFCRADLPVFWDWHCHKAAEASLLLVRVTDISRYGQVQLDAEGRIGHFVEKAVGKGGGWINGGVYLIKRDLLQTIPADRAVSLERQMFPQWLNGKVYGYCSEGRFLDIGTPESYAIAEEFFALEAGG